MDSYEAYNLAFKNGSSKEHEDIIMMSPDASYRYARYILKGPFSAGEASIAKWPSTSYLYAKHVLKGPFRMGEDSICWMPTCIEDIRHPCRLDYQFLFGRQVCSLEVLSTYPLYALAHAVSIGGRFPFGEPTMQRSPRIWKRYQEFLNDT